MATEKITPFLKTDIVKQYKDSYIRMSPKNVGYIFISRALASANDLAVSSMANTQVGDTDIWDSMIAAKKIVPGDIEIVIPKYQWSQNTVYKAFDDDVELSSLLDSSGNSEPMYVINTNGDVYKCLSNNQSANSTVEPSGDYTTSNGFISNELSDGYVWKYMYNVKNTNKFLTENWIPCPYSQSEVVPVEYRMDTSNYIDGTIDEILITNAGQNYVHTTLNVASFSAGNTSLNITGVGASTANLAVNMLVEGTGITTNTFITSISAPLNRIFLSKATTGSGGGTGNSVSVVTRVHIDGDGTDCMATATLSGNGLGKITITNNGSGYRKANVYIYGSGTNASARVIVSPKYGHGFSPAKELYAKDLMFITRIGEIDSTENGLVSVDTSFRQYGLLSKPHKYGETVSVAETNANSVISQTLDLTLFTGASYQIGEVVYQGSPANKTFYGYVNSQDATTVKLTNHYGTPSVGALVYGESSAIQRPLISVKNPEFEPYSGEILYAKNILKVERESGQAEEIKLILNF